MILLESLEASRCRRRGEPNIELIGKRACPVYPLELFVRHLGFNLFPISTHTPILSLFKMEVLYSFLNIQGSLLCQLIRSFFYSKFPVCFTH